MAKDKEILEGICSGLSGGGSLAVVTLWRGGVEHGCLAVSATGDIVSGDINRSDSGPFLNRVRAVVESGRAVQVLDGVDLLGGFDRAVIEVLRPKVRILVFGAGHVGQAVANIAAMVGYDVKVFDDREDFLVAERFPGGNIEICSGSYSEQVARANINPRDAVVIVTRGHQYDEICLRGVVRSNAGYIGMIGSKRRVISVFKRLREDGYGEQELSRVYAPIGLPIGAVSPQEIAVAIVAQVIEVMNKHEERS